MEEYALSVIIPTIGRPTLMDTLDSICAQPRASECQVIVVEDARVPPAQSTAKLTLERDMHWCQYAGGMWGQAQRNHGMSHATGQWLCFLQDDDIWTPDALDAILATLDSGTCPKVFQVRTWQAGNVPRCDGSENDYPPDQQGGNVDADGIVVPNVPGKVGEFTNDYAGDFFFFRRTVQFWDGAYEVIPKVIALGRPKISELWWQPVSARRQGY